MKVWITKWWGAHGIQEQDEVRLTDNGYAVRRVPYLFVRIGSDAFLTKEDAVANLREKANRKLAALDRQKAKIRKMLAGLESDTRASEQPEAE